MADETEPTLGSDETDDTLPTIAGKPDVSEITASGSGSSLGSQGSAASVASAPRDTLYPKIEGYQVIGHLGEGGMGTVYRAVQLGNKREVALKLMSARSLGSDKAKRRFEREVELASSLTHPHIAPVYDTGLDRGVYYYAMPLVDGLPLDRYVQSNQLDHRAIVALMSKVSAAVDYAHRRGVIHRDLKPSNIMIDKKGDPVVMDFGLAKSLTESVDGDDAKAGISMDGDLAGTPAYMSPEQAAGRTSEIDTRSDVYALGVILFRLVTRESPHELTGTTFEVMRRIVEEDPRTPRSMSPTIDRDLEAILLKCLSKQPADRYGSAGAFAQDLDMFLAGEPISAHPATLTYFVGKRLRKHKPAVATSLAVVLTVLGSVLFYIVSINAERQRTDQARANAVTNAERATANALRAETNAERANANALLANTNADKAREATQLALDRESSNRAQLIRVYVDRALQESERGDHGAALLLQAEAFRLDAEAAAARSKAKPIESVSTDSLGGTVPASDQSLTRVDAVSDAQPEFVGHRLRFGQTLSLMDPAPVMVSHSAGVRIAKFAPGSQRFVTASDDGTARVWDAFTGKPITPPLKHEKELADVNFSPDGTMVATASVDGSARVWDANTGQPITPPLLHMKFDRQEPVLAAKFSPDNKALLTLGVNGKASLWDIRSAKLRFEPITAADRDGAMRFGDFSRDGTKFFTVSSGSLLRIWDSATGAPLTEFISVKEVPTYATFSPDSSRVITTGLYGYANQWDAVTGEEIGTRMEQPPFRQLGIGFADYRPDGQQIVTAGRSDNCARFWDAKTGAPLPGKTIQMASHVWHTEFSPRGHHVVVACDDGVARVFLAKPDGSKPITPPFTHGGAVHWATFSDDGLRVLTASIDGTARIFNITKQAALSTRLEHQSSIPISAISPDGKWLANGGSDGSVWLWNLQTGVRVEQALPHKQVINYMHFRADSKQLLVIDNQKSYVGGKPSFWNLGDDDQWRSSQILSEVNSSATRYLDADRLLTSTPNGMETWDARTGEKIATFNDIPYRWPRLSISQAGGLAASSKGKAVTVWNTTTGKHLHTFEHATDTSRVLISADGRRVVTTSRDGQTMIWDTSTGELLVPGLARGDGASDPMSFAISPDSTMLATGHRGGAMRVWDISTGQPITPPMLLDGFVYDVVFSPDSKVISGISENSWARAFEARTGLPVSPKLWYIKTFESAKLNISPDGKNLVLTGGSSTVTKWNLNLFDQSAEDAAALAAILSQRKIDNTGTIVAIDSAEWQSLKERYAKKFPRFIQSKQTAE